jgi:hypothetical protein
MRGARAWRGTARAVGIGPRPVVGASDTGATGSQAGPGDAGARWASAGCGRARQHSVALICGTRSAAAEGGIK